MRSLDARQTIWTIGHSTRPFDRFVAILRSFEIEVLADIRSYPGSRRFPHFNKESLELSLPECGIEYIHLPELGGRRKPLKESRHPEWRNASFRAYADYMDTPEFVHGLEQLEARARTKRTAYMCSEALWWRCHRRMVSDRLRDRGWLVVHIMDVARSSIHPSADLDIQHSLFDDSKN